MVRVQGRWPLLGHADSFDELQIGILFLGLKKLRVVRCHGVDLGGRRGAEVQRNSGSSFVLDDKIVLECGCMKTGIRFLVEM